MILPRSKYGIHIANSGPAFVDSLVSAGFDAFFGLQINLGDLETIRSKRPDGFFMVRWYDTNIMGRDPRGLAQEMVDWAYTHQFFNLVPGNELNLGCEHQGAPGHGPNGNWDTYQDYQTVEGWLLEVLKYGREFDRYGKIKWGRPAESPGHSEDSSDNGFIAWESFPWSLQQYDFITVHSYWETPDQASSEWFGWRWKRKLAILEKLGAKSPVMITETNRQWDHRAGCDDAIAYRNELLALYAETYRYPQIACVCPFIWASADASFAALAMVDQGGAEQPVVWGIRSSPKPSVSVAEPPSSDLVSRYGGGFASALEAYPGLTGKPLQSTVQIATQQEVPDRYDAYAFSFLVCEKGLLLWRKHNNELIFLANDGRTLHWDGSRWA